MPLVTALQTQEYQFQYQVLEGIWYWTTRVDVSRTAPVYSITSIQSPFGLLRDAIAIPGSVVTAMSTSIVELQQAFPPSILLDMTALTITLDEGRGYGLHQDVLVTNTGTYGSLLATTWTTSAAYVRVSPASVGGLSVGESGSVQITADSTELLASASPYAATVVVQDATASNTPQVVSLVLVVRPKAHISVSPTSRTFTVVAPISGPFDPVPSQTLTLTNSGLAASNLDFQVCKLINNSPWLVSYIPVSGSLTGQTSTTITLGVIPVGLSVGVYQETLRISGYSDNLYVDVPVTLTVT